jgi:hypothetical protein
MAALLRCLVLVVLGAGCAWDAPPVEWQSPAPIASRPDSMVRYAARWIGGGSPDVVVETPVADTTVQAPLPMSACPGSIVETPTLRGHSWSAWWQVRRDSSAVLLAASRDSAGNIEKRIVVDSVDVALLGCARPAPAIMLDSINGYVHVSYYMVAPEGPGLFYAHLMNPAMPRFEAPLAIVYGERPVRVALGSRGDTVAVVYEDPNSEQGRIAMSISLTAGHLFEQSARLIPVSTSSQSASAPQVVRLSGTELWVGWTESSASGSAFLLRRARIVTR